MKKAIAYEIVDHGVEHSQYFQGCGTAFTDFDMVFTGIGYDALEAYNDAIEQAYMADIDSNILGTLLPEVPESLNPNAAVPESMLTEEDSEIWYHVSIRLKME